MRFIYRVPQHDGEGYWTWRGAGYWTAEEVAGLRDRAYETWSRISRLID